MCQGGEFLVAFYVTVPVKMAGWLMASLCVSAAN